MACPAGIDEVGDPVRKAQTEVDHEDQVPPEPSRIQPKGESGFVTRASRQADSHLRPKPVPSSQQTEKHPHPEKGHGTEEAFFNQD